MDTEAPIGQRMLEADSIIMAKEKCSYKKAMMVRSTLAELGSRYSIDSIYIEENLQRFRRGLSSAKVLSTLARFNGVVTYLAHDEFGVAPTMLNVNTARKSIGLVINKKIKKEVSIKEQVVKWVREHPDFKDFSWPYKTLKSGPRKGLTILDTSSYDIADAAVMCLAGIVA